MLCSYDLHAEEVIRADAVSVAGERDTTELRKDAATQMTVIDRKEIENLKSLILAQDER